MKNKIEIIANSVLTAVGIVGGVFFAVKGDAGVSSVMFSIALACILYQFLGGISQDHSFQLGAIKLGGTAAVLIMFMYFLKTNILKDVLEIKPDTEWIAISSKTGETVNVTIKHNEEVVYPKGEVISSDNSRSKQSFKLVDGDSTFILQPSLTDEQVGRINVKNDAPKSLFRKLSPSLESGMIRFYLTPDSKPTTGENLQEIERRLPGLEWVNSNKKMNHSTAARTLPFEIKVSGAQVTITKNDGTVIANEDIVAQTCYIVPHKTENGGICSYIVFLEQADHMKTRINVSYSKWLVKLVYHVL